MSHLSAEELDSLILNPHTPMAFLPPDIAHQITIGTYVVVATLGVLIWDTLDNLGLDYVLLTRFPLRCPTVAYTISRLTTLAYFLTAAIFLTSPIGHCKAVGLAASFLFVGTIGSTAGLFLLRVRAIYGRDPYVTAFFSFLWLTVIAGCLTLPFALPTMNLGPTNYCIQGRPAWYLIWTSITPFINDTVVFIAITWRLMQTSHDEQTTFLQRLKVVALGSSMPAFSRALLRDGQAYYLLSVVLRLVTFIMFYFKPIPVVYRSLFGMPCVALIHIAACRVFRNTKFGIFHESPCSGRRPFSTDDPLARHRTLPIAFAQNSFLPVPDTRQSDFPTETEDSRKLEKWQESSGSTLGKANTSTV